LRKILYVQVCDVAKVTR